jgi:hypothetical protein
MTTGPHHAALSSSPSELEIEMKLTKVFTQWSSGVPLITDANIVWVSMSGSDATGDGTVVLPVASITKAFTLVNATRNKVVVLPGSYEEAAAVVWPLFTGVQLVGIGTVEISAIGVTHVLGITPGVMASTFEATIENIYLDHSNSGQDGIVLNNTAMTKKLNLYLKNVSSDNDDGDTLATVHGDTDNAIRVYWDGDKGEGISGAINFTGGNNGDRVYVSHANLNGGFVSSVTAVVAKFRFVQCRILHEGITAGHASQTVLLVDCYSFDDPTWAKADANEVATQTETIVD